MSDRSGFATGGTSAAWTVQQASSSAQPCFNETQEATQAWFFDQVPANTNGVLISCETYLFEWYTQDPGIVGSVPNIQQLDVKWFSQSDNFRAIERPTLSRSSRPAIHSTSLLLPAIWGQMLLTSILRDSTGAFRSNPVQVLFSSVETKEQLALAVLSTTMSNLLAILQPLLVPRHYSPRHQASLPVAIPQIMLHHCQAVPHRRVHRAVVRARGRLLSLVTTIL